MSRQKRVGSALIGLLFIMVVSHVHGAMLPFHPDHMDASLLGRPVPLISNHMRVPLAVPSFGHATTTQEHVPDLLPVSERMYQDRHWGYWLGYTSWNGCSFWNGYSFLLPGEGASWGHTGTRMAAMSTEPVPEPASLILFGLGGVWMAARTRRGRCAVRGKRVRS